MEDKQGLKVDEFAGPVENKEQMWYIGIERNICYLYSSCTSPLHFLPRLDRSTCFACFLGSEILRCMQKSSHKPPLWLTLKSRCTYAESRQTYQGDSADRVRSVFVGGCQPESQRLCNSISPRYAGTDGNISYAQNTNPVTVQRRVRR